MLDLSCLEVVNKCIKIILLRWWKIWEIACPVSISFMFYTFIFPPGCPLIFLLRYIDTKVTKKGTSYDRRPVTFSLTA
jgi:hypothetical protein